ncbi:hypothetical protein [Pseudogracilibacillus sp. SO30301A]|uniref:hypothetical protein n=1 Tax=Pseudogracilibacillus sp. SO30301A TaxID=3098291 RepID=UPI00300DFD2B
MKKIIWLYVILAGMLFLVACSEGKETEGEQVSKKEEESAGVKDYIGEQITISEDGSIELPFDDQVLAADFSGDGNIKLLAFDDYVIIVEGEEIIHAEEAAPKHHLHSDELSVSEDGRFVTWRGHLDDLEISVYDVENREVHLVEKTEEWDPYDIFAPHLIEKHGDIYYLMTNDYWAAMGLNHLDDGSVKVLDLNNLEIKSDRETIEKVTPKEPIEDDDMYHDLNARAAELGLEEGPYSEDGYFKYFFAIEEAEDEDTMLLTNLYGGDVVKSELKEMKLEDLEFGKDEIRVMSFKELDTEQIQVADNGMFILPVVDGEVEENDYKLNVYIADLTDENPIGTLVIEEEVTNVRPTVFFNEDETAIYLSKEGILEKYDVKE